MPYVPVHNAPLAADNSSPAVRAEPPAGVCGTTKCHRAERFDGIAAAISLQFLIRQAADFTAKIRTLQFNQKRHRTVYKLKYIRKLGIR